MSKAWEEDLSRSTEIFQNAVYPEINSLLAEGGELVPVEAVTDSDMADKLDQLAGVDFWCVESGRGMYGLASRVQDNGKDWGTFTVRRRRFSGATTEFEKRKKQIEENYLYPRYTVQAYTDGFDFLNAGIVKTKQLINFIDTGVKGKDYMIRDTHNADFYVVDWLDIDAKHSVKIHNRDIDIDDIENPGCVISERPDEQTQPDKPHNITNW